VLIAPSLSSMSAGRSFWAASRSFCAATTLCSAFSIDTWPDAESMSTWLSAWFRAVSDWTT